MTSVGVPPMVIMLSPLYTHLDISCVITWQSLGVFTWEPADSCICISFTFLVHKILFWWLSENLYVHSCAYVWKDNSRFQLPSALWHSLETRESNCRSASWSTHTIIRRTFMNWNISCSVPFLIRCLPSIRTSL